MRERHRHRCEVNPVFANVFKKAGYLFLMKVPKGTSACNHLEQEKNTVLEAMRAEFLVAFDILSPTVGLTLGLSGKEAAQLVFPEK